MESFFHILIYLATGFTIGVITQTLVTWANFRKKTITVVMPEEPDDPNLDIMANEWRTTIQMQMKFNDLIIRFRAIVLSVFMLSVGALFHSYSTGSIVGIDLTIMLGMLLIFWLACFILDYGYYHQLLLGAVRHARKFDENQFFRSKGLFGLTEQINMEISLLRSKVIMWLFYLFPMIILFTLMVLKETQVI